MTESAQERIARIRESQRTVHGTVGNTPTPTPTKPVKQEIVADSRNKVYFARAAHSRFIFSDNQEIIFHFGRAEVGPGYQPGIYRNPTNHNHPSNGKFRWQVYQEELDEILGNNPNIYVAEAIPEPLPTPAQNARSEAEIALAERQLQQAGISGVVTQQVDAPTVVSMDPNENSLDPELQKALFERAGSAPSIS